MLSLNGPVFDDFRVGTPSLTLPADLAFADTCARWKVYSFASCPERQVQTTGASAPYMSGQNAGRAGRPVFS